MGFSIPFLRVVVAQPFEHRFAAVDGIEVKKASPPRGRTSCASTLSTPRDRGAG